MAEGTETAQRTDRRAVLANGFAGIAPAGVGSNWQAGVGAINRALREVDALLTTAAARLRSTGGDDA